MNPRDPSFMLTPMALLAPGVAEHRHPMGPGLRLTKLLTVFKTLMGRVLGAPGHNKKVLFF